MTASSTNNSPAALRVIDIIEGTSVDGPGLRTSVYLAGCDHHCPGCHNPQTWPRDAGRDMTVDEILRVIDIAGFNVTLSGGDPVYQAERLLPLLQAIHCRGKTVWLYTGFTYGQLLAIPAAKALLPYIEAVVDGPFVLELRDTTLPFRGSSNQRIIYPHQNEENPRQKFANVAETS